MSREGKLAKNTFVLAIGNFLPKLASFITLPILTGCLTQRDYGTYDLITVLVSLVLPVATLQIQTAAFRYLIDLRHDQKESKRIITNIYAFIIPSSFLALVILFFCLSSLAIYMRILICLYFMTDILVNASRQVVRGLSRNSDYSVSAIISSAGKMLFVTVCVWYFQMGIIGATAALCGADFCALCYLVLRVKVYRYIDLRLFSVATVKELLAYSWPMVPNSMSMWVMRVSDRLVVTFFMGVSANAVYSVANKIPQLLTIAQTTFTMAWQENASVYSKDDDAPAYYSAMFKIMYNLMAGVMGMLIAATPILFRMLIRGDYTEAYFQIPILFIGMFFYSISAYLGGIYVAYKKTKSVGITTMAAAACNLIVDMALIKHIGLYAASGSTLVSYLFLFLFRMTDVRKIVEITYDFRQIGCVFMLLVSESVLCYLQRPVLNVINLALGVTAFLILNNGLIKAACQKVLRFLQKWFRGLI